MAHGQAPAFAGSGPRIVLFLAASRTRQFERTIYPGDALTLLRENISYLFPILCLHSKRLCSYFFTAMWDCECDDVDDVRRDARYPPIRDDAEVCPTAVA